MFRILALSTLCVLASCSGRPNGANQSSANTAATAPEPLVSDADARDTKAIAQHYFDLLRGGDDAGALALWSDDAAVKLGGAKAFAAANRKLGRYEGSAGEATGVRDSGGVRYALVEASARVTSPKGKVTDEHGVVMLKRPAQGSGPWRIWGIDVRPRHCRPGQVAKGLGCVAL